MFGKGKDRRKKRRTNIVSLYDELLYTILAANDSTKIANIKLDRGQIGVDFTGTQDVDKINYYYILETLPQELYIDWRERLRRESRGNVKITFLDTIQGHQILWESPQMQSRLRILKQAREETDTKDIDAYNMHKNIKDLAKQNWIEESLLYLSEADKTRGRTLLTTSTLMVISGVKGVEFNESVKLVETYAKHIGVGLKRVLFEVPGVIEYFSPFKHEMNKEIVGNIPKHILTDEIFARNNTYTQGTIGYKGMYFGTDVYSNKPILKEVKRKAEDAENWLITAETGGGKSFLVKMLVLQLLGLGFNGTIMDIEGREYLPIAEFLKHKSTVHVINMGEGGGKYFDPVAITPPVGIPEVDLEARKMSINFTISIIKVLLGRAYHSNDWIDAVINDAVMETYRDHGITEDPDTWGLSETLTLHDVFEVLPRLLGNRDRASKEYEEAVNHTIAVLSKYFLDDGTRAEIFKNRIHVEDIMDADLVVCSFGMEGKSEQSVDEVQLALMQLSAAHISHQRSIFSKAQGKYNFKLWEEFQRWGDFPDSDKTLGVAVTGGRKLGDVNIIITNVVKKLLEEDRFGIFGNLQSIILGAIDDAQVREDLCERLSIPKMLPELDLIAKSAEKKDHIGGEASDVVESEGDKRYRYSFLYGLDRSEYGVGRIDLPEEISKTSLFQSGGAS